MVLPPLETFMDLPHKHRRERFFKAVNVGDVVLGCVTGIDEFSLTVILLCMEYDKPLQIDDLKIRAFCKAVDLPRKKLEKKPPIEGRLPDPPNSSKPTIKHDRSFKKHGTRGEISRILGDNYFGNDEDKDDSGDEDDDNDDRPSLKGYHINDNIRGVVVGFEDNFLIISMMNEDLPSEVEHSISLGFIKDVSLPEYYKTMIQFGIKTYQWHLRQAHTFKNRNISYWSQVLGVKDTSSLMVNLQSNTYDDKDYAPYLRTKQLLKMVIQSIADGIRYTKEKRYDKALRCLDQALDVDSNNMDALVARGTLYASMGKYCKAIEDFEAVLDVNAHHNKAKLYLCETLIVYSSHLMEQDQDNIAFNFLKRLLALNPTNKEAKSLLSHIEFKLKDVQRVVYIDKHKGRVLKKSKALKKERERSSSPHRSRSDKKGSPYKTSRSPDRRSKSHKRQSRSPHRRSGSDKKSRSHDRKSKLQSRKSKSPDMRFSSLYEKSRSPDKRSRSHSKSVKKKSKKKKRSHSSSSNSPDSGLSREQKSRKMLLPSSPTEIRHSKHHKISERSSSGKVVFEPTPTATNSTKIACPIMVEAKSTPASIMERFAVDFEKDALGTYNITPTDAKYSDGDQIKDEIKEGSGIDDIEEGNLNTKMSGSNAIASHIFESKNMSLESLDFNMKDAQNKKRENSKEKENETISQKHLLIKNDENLQDSLKNVEIEEISKTLIPRNGSETEIAEVKLKCNQHNVFDNTEESHNSNDGNQNISCKDTSKLNAVDNMSLDDDQNYIAFSCNSEDKIIDEINLNEDRQKYNSSVVVFGNTNLDIDSIKNLIIDEFGLDIDASRDILNTMQLMDYERLAFCNLVTFRTATLANEMLLNSHRHSQIRRRLNQPRIIVSKYQPQIHLRVHLNNSKKYFKSVKSIFSSDRKVYVLFDATKDRTEVTSRKQLEDMVKKRLESCNNVSEDTAVVHCEKEILVKSSNEEDLSCKPKLNSNLVTIITDELKNVNAETFNIDNLISHLNESATCSVIFSLKENVQMCNVKNVLMSKLQMSLKEQDIYRIEKIDHYHSVNVGWATNFFITFTNRGIRDKLMNARNFKNGYRMEHYSSEKHLCNFLLYTYMGNSYLHKQAKSLIHKIFYLDQGVYVRFIDDPFKHLKVRSNVHFETILRQKLLKYGMSIQNLPRVDEENHLDMSNVSSDNDTYCKISEKLSLPSKIVISFDVKNDGKIHGRTDFMLEQLGLLREMVYAKQFTVEGQAINLCIKYPFKDMKDRNKVAFFQLYKVLSCVAVNGNNLASVSNYQANKLKLPEWMPGSVFIKVMFHLKGLNTIDAYAENIVHVLTPTDTPEILSLMVKNDIKAPLTMGLIIIFLNQFCKYDGNLLSTFLTTKVTKVFADTFLSFWKSTKQSLDLKGPFEAFKFYCYKCEREQPVIDIVKQNLSIVLNNIGKCCHLECPLEVKVRKPTISENVANQQNVSSKLPVPEKPRKVGAASAKQSDPISKAIEQCTKVQAQQSKYAKHAKGNNQSPVKMCKICNMRFLNPSMAEIHFGGVRHYKKLREQEEALKKITLLQPLMSLTLDKIEDDKSLVRSHPPERMSISVNVINGTSVLADTSIMTEQSYLLRDMVADNKYTVENNVLKVTLNFPFKLVTSAQFGANSHRFEEFTYQDLLKVLQGMAATGKTNAINKQDQSSQQLESKVPFSTLLKVLHFLKGLHNINSYTTSMIAQINPGVAAESFFLIFIHNWTLKHIRGLLWTYLTIYLEMNGDLVIDSFILPAKQASSDEQKNLLNKFCQFTKQTTLKNVEKFSNFWIKCFVCNTLYRVSVTVKNAVELSSSSCLPSEPNICHRKCLTTKRAGKILCSVCWKELVSEDSQDVGHIHDRLDFVQEQFKTSSKVLEDSQNSMDNTPSDTISLNVVEKDLSDSESFDKDQHHPDMDCYLELVEDTLDSNVLFVTGLPESSDENIKYKVMQLVDKCKPLTGLIYFFLDGAIEDCFRLNSKHKDRDIVIHFKDKRVRDSVYNCRNNVKDVVINKPPTPIQLSLFKQAIAYKNQAKIFDTFFDQFKIYIIVKPGTDAVVVYTKSHMDTIISLKNKQNQTTEPEQSKNDFVDSKQTLTCNVTSSKDIEPEKSNCATIVKTVALQPAILPQMECYIDLMESEVADKILIFSGIPETDEDNIEGNITELISKELHLTPKDFMEDCYRQGSRVGCRDIIVVFSFKAFRGIVYAHRKRLKTVVINKCLSGARLLLFKQALLHKEKGHLYNVCADDHKIYVTVNCEDDRVPLFTSLDLERIISGKQ